MARRVKWAAALLFALLALAAGFHQWPISSAFVARETGAGLSQSLGLQLLRPARARFSLLPTPTLRMDDVELRGEDHTTILTAPEASARLALLALLAGRFEITAATLRRPTILLDLDSRPFAPTSAIATTIATGSADRVATPLGALTIQGGLLRIVSAAGKFDTLVEDVEGTLDWMRIEDPLRLDLRARWRDAPLAIEADLGAPADLLRRARAPLRLSVLSSLAQLKLEGDIVGEPALRFEGAVSADVASLAGLKRIFGVADPAGLSDGHIALAAKAAGDAKMLTLSEMRLEILGQPFEGALAVTKSADRLALSGTLATDELNLEPVLARVPSLVDANGEWSAAPFDFAMLGALDFDLRVSVAQIQWRGHPLADAAIELMNKAGHLTATLIEANAYGGLLKGELSVAPSEPGFVAQASGSLANADIGALCADFGWANYSGQGGAAFAFEARGESPAAFARDLAGKATVQLAAGIIDGLSFEEALRRSERRPIDVFNDMRMGRTVFGQAAASVVFERGGLGAVNAALAGPGVSLSVAGTTDIVRRNLSVRATATQTDKDGAPASDGPRLDLDVTGPWSAPRIKPFAGSG